MAATPIIKNELARMETHFRLGLEICHKLKEKLEGVSTPSNTRKGLSKKEEAKLLAGRRLVAVKK
jgi:hypothetical protein